MHLPRSVLLALVAALAGCSGTTLEAHFRVSERASEAVARRDPGSAGVLSQAGRVSFTPASLRVSIKALYLCRGVEPAPNIGVNCTKDHQIKAGEGTGEVELVGVDASTDVLSFTADVGASDLGTYRAVLVLFGGDGLNAYQTVTASPSADGQTYAFTDLALPMRGTGMLVQLPTPLELTADTSAVLELVFDVESPMYLVRDPNTPTAVQIPGSDVFVDSSALVLLPYAGREDATIDKYEIVLDTDAFGPPDSYFLKVVAVRDPTGALMAMQWQTVFRAGFDRYGAIFQPGPMFSPKFTSSGGTYAIDEDPADSVSPPGSRLSFPAFSLSDHTGTLVYGGAPYTYTASVRP